MAGTSNDQLKQMLVAQQAMIAKMAAESQQVNLTAKRLDAYMVQERKQKLADKAAKDAAEAAAAKMVRPPKRGSLDKHSTSTKRVKATGALDLSTPYDTRVDTQLSDILRKDPGQLAVALLEPYLWFITNNGRPMGDDHILEAAIILPSMCTGGFGELCHPARRNRAPPTHPAAPGRGS